MPISCYLTRFRTNDWLSIWLSYQYVCSRLFDLLNTILITFLATTTYGIYLEGRGKFITAAEWWYLNEETHALDDFERLSVITSKHIIVLTLWKTAIMIKALITFVIKQALWSMGLLPDTWNCGLRMRRECRERFPRHQLQRKPLVSNPGMHHGTCVTHVPWCMSGSLTCGGRGKRSRHSRRMRNPQFYVSGKRPIWTSLLFLTINTKVISIIIEAYPQLKRLMCSLRSSRQALIGLATVRRWKQAIAWGSVNVTHDLFRHIVFDICVCTHLSTKMYAYDFISFIFQTVTTYTMSTKTGTRFD